MIEIKYDKPARVCFDEDDFSEGTRNFCSDFVCFPKVAGSGIPDPLLTAFSVEKCSLQL